ncbi:MAG: hypothetical protein PWP23_949 [Candidatus Sumerlaeota bacterium]|nr:hypothetical protein [Candidatus Sumerlaeota bacterium]
MYHLQYVAVGFQAAVLQRHAQEMCFGDLPRSEQEILMERSRRALAERRRALRRGEGAWQRRLKAVLAVLFPPPLTGSPYPEA